MSEQQQQPSGNASQKPRILNEIRRLDNVQGPPDRSMPERVGEHYTKEGNAYLSAHRPGKIEFIDRGSRMHAYNPVSTFTARTLVETAELRGWKELEVTGHAKFQQGIYVEAASRGLNVRGYEPTEKDKEILDRRNDRKAAESNPMVQAFLSAETDKERKAATKEYPQLKQAFAADKEAKEFAETKIAQYVKTTTGKFEVTNPKAVNAFVDRARDNIALALHRGQEIKLARAEPQQQAPAAQREPERDQGRSR